MVSDAHLNLLASSVMWSVSQRGLQVNVPSEVDLTGLPKSIQQTKYSDLTIVSLTSNDAQFVKQVLHDANVYSLVCRYDDNPNDFVMQKFQFVYFNDDVAFYKTFFGAIKCFEYQACEPRDWEKTFAYFLVRAMQEKLLSEFTDGYWEYNPEPPPTSPTLIEVFAKPEEKAEEKMEAQPENKPTIRYVHNEFPELEYVYYPLKGKAQYAYGRKITTQYGVKIGNKKYRVYASQISNSAMYYIVVKKEMYVVQDTALLRIKA
jgi:hypothetical protein